MTSLNKSRPNHFLKRDSEKLCNKVDQEVPTKIDCQIWYRCVVFLISITKGSMYNNSLAKFL